MLQAAVAGLPPGTSLGAKVQQALDALNRGNTTSACNILSAFINEAQAQSGKNVFDNPVWSTLMIGNGPP